MEETKPTPKPSAPLTQWPGAFGVYGASRDAVRRNLSTIILLIVISIGAGIVIGIIFGRVGWLNEIVSYLIGAVIGAAQLFALIGSVRGRTVELPDAISEGLPLFFKFFLLQLLVAMSVLGGLILLIVPGLVILPRLVLAPYFLVDKNMGILEAYQASWDATKGHSGKVWGIIGVLFLMALPSITIIGIVLTAYWVVLYSAAPALLYQYLIDHGQKGQKSPVAQPEPAPAPAPAE